MTDKAPAVFIRTCDLGILLGWENISTLPGCQEYQVGGVWWFAINPHGEYTPSSHGTKVPPYSIFFEFNGSPAGCIRATGGVMAAGAEDTLLAALDRAIKNLGGE